MPSKRSIPTTTSAKFTNPYISKDAHLPLAMGNVSSQRSLERPETSASSMTRLRPVSRPQAVPPSDSKINMKGNLLMHNPKQFSDLIGGSRVNQGSNSAERLDPNTVEDNNRYNLIEAPSLDQISASALSLPQNPKVRLVKQPIKPWMLNANTQLKRLVQGKHANKSFSVLKTTQGQRAMTQSNFRRPTRSNQRVSIHEHSYNSQGNLNNSEAIQSSIISQPELKRILDQHTMNATTIPHTSFKTTQKQLGLSSIQHSRPASVSSNHFSMTTNQPQLGGKRPIASLFNQRLITGKQRPVSQLNRDPATGR